MTRSFGRVDVDLHRGGVGAQEVEQVRVPLHAVEDDDLVDRRLLGGGRGAVHEQRDGDEDLRAGVLQLEGDLVGRVERVDRRHHAAGRGDAVEDHRVPGGVRAEDGDDVALAQAPGVQVGGDAVDVGGELAVGDRVALEAVDQRRGVRALPAGGEDELGHRQVRDLDIGIRAGQGHGSSSSVLMWRQSHIPRGPAPQGGYSRGQLRVTALQRGQSTDCVQRNSAIVFPVPASVTTASQTCVVRPAWAFVATAAIRPSRDGAQEVRLELDRGEAGRAVGQQRAGGQPARGVGQADDRRGVQVAVGRQQVRPDVERGLQPAGLVRGDLQARAGPAACRAGVR